MEQSGIALPKWPSAPCAQSGCYACTYQLPRRVKSAGLDGPASLIMERCTWVTATSTNPEHGWRIVKMLCSGDRTWAFITFDGEGGHRSAFVHFDDLVLDRERRFRAVPEVVRETMR